jgi:3-dehydroquinate synthase
MIIPIELNEHSYDIYVDENISFTEKLKEMFPKSTFVLITNHTIKKLYSSMIKEWDQSLNLLRFTIDDGEQFKTLQTWNAILDFLLKSRLDRNTVIIALGGGVVGDIAGFAASTFLRGVNYVQVPTTLLAMVDSSVGGKTGVNHKMGKNLIGAFFQPKLVWIDQAFLTSLPEREFLAGYGEVFKYAFIGGKEMFDFISSKHEKILEQKKLPLSEAVIRSIKIKARIVSEDEKESGIRALLNFGHTFGHALERFFNYKEILHGEAIYWGIKCAANLGIRIKLIPDENVKQFEDIFTKLTLPKLALKPDCNELYTHMLSDKKIQAGKLRFVLPVKPGVSVIKDDVAEDDVLETLREVFG